MLKDLEQTAKYISSWIAFQAKSAKMESLVVGISGGVDSALVAALCKRTGMPTYGVMMPCHSSIDGISRAEQVIEEFKITDSIVYLNTAFEAVVDQVLSDSVDRGYEYPQKQWNEYAGALRSCLRAPVLDFVAKIRNGLVVGTGNKDEDQVVRYYQKRGDGAVDISPIADLHKSEVYQLAEYLGVPESVLKATPSADLWAGEVQEDEKELGMTYAEIERATKFVENLFGTTQGQAFFQAAGIVEAYSGAGRDVEVLRKLGNMEIASRHKSNPNIPVCRIGEIGVRA